MSRSPVVLALSILAGALSLPSHALDARGQTPAAPAPGTVMVIETAKGTIEITLTPASAPRSVERVLGLAKSNFYRGQRIHWAQPGVVQFGDPQSRDMTKQEAWGRGGTGKPIGVAEPSKGPFVRGSVAMAYRSNLAPATADSQIAILTGPNPALNGKYAMLGRVTRGIEVVDKLVVGDLIKAVTVK
jgi:cyclophilin family peptidyl-prolyl cis-trans isomerase